MADSMVQHKQCWMGMAIQTGVGVVATAPTVLFPISEEAAMGYKPNYSFFQYADAKMSGPRGYWSGGEWSEGSLSLPLVPGMLADAGGSGGMNGTITVNDAIADIGMWAFARTHTGATSANYGQGLFASVFRYTFHTQEVFQDVKITSGKIGVSFGQRAMLDLNLLGLRKPATVTTMDRDSVTLAETAVETAPYTFAGASLTLGATGAAVADIVTNDHSLDFDNMCAGADESGSLSGAAYPRYLPNNELAQWTATFNRHYLNATYYAYFLAGTEGQYTLTLVSGATTAIISFPRLVYTDSPLVIPASGFLGQDGISFQALASVVGDTYAWTITES